MPLQPPPQLKASMFGRMPVGGSKSQGGTPAAAPGPKGVRVEHRIGVQAPAEVIWELIRDVDAWSSWNPLYARASGSLHIGEVLDLEVVLPGMKPQATKATVLEWVPNEQLHYQTRGLGGLIRGTRYVEIEALAPESCIVSNGEIMGGFLGPRLAPSLGPRIYRAIKGMNEALKEKAESMWQERQR
ncbi:MAG TPA: SRPBCC domain-containing protein [Phenylobacterium sp.]|uniref:SRPBCC domain-containing protein n=1 Tax=Phenylobacterium sp. TaxID=1871053 RepID=UPI002B47CB48|nr:SRPBCC domain-containing protein [Phenylobacterium sp.]HKR86670.1 SRPBCC domain-containing protein [Phenylobacterium sp.]